MNMNKIEEKREKIREINRLVDKRNSILCGPKGTITEAAMKVVYQYGELGESYKLSKKIEEINKSY